MINDSDTTSDFKLHSIYKMRYSSHYPFLAFVGCAATDAFEKKKRSSL